MSYDSLLIHTCDIGALSQVGADAYGTPVESWLPLAYTAKECRLMSTTGREIKVGAKVMISDWKMFLPLDVTIDEQARISNIKMRATGLPIEVVSTYEVLLVQPRSDSTILHHKELALQKVK